jgi:hypothetical protein
MKYSDVQVGMIIKFNKHDSLANHQPFHADPVREEAYRQWLYNKGEEVWNQQFKRYENQPIRVIRTHFTRFNVRPMGARVRQDVTYNVIKGIAPDGEEINLLPKYFKPDDESAIQLASPVPEKLVDEVSKYPAKRSKDTAMGELRALPGAVDYEAVKSRFGKGRTRRSRRVRKTRRSRR